jgi:hypothetical protein
MLNEKVTLVETIFDGHSLRPALLRDPVHEREGLKQKRRDSEYFLAPISKSAGPHQLHEPGLQNENH